MESQFNGGELQATVLLLNMAVGLLRHIEGDQRAFPWLFTWSVGLGF